MTLEEREAIQELPMNAINLNKWEKKAWAAIMRRDIGYMVYEDARHAALYLNSTLYQACMLELIRDAAKLRLLA